MKLAITNDHGAVDLKNTLKAAFPDIEWVDVGTQAPTPSVDYPDYGYLMAQLIERGEVEMGVGLCGSGVGISIALNRSKAVRAVLCNDPIVARLSREHNDANVICLGGRLTTPLVAIECLKVFLSTAFEGGRHQNRVEKLTRGC